MNDLNGTPSKPNLTFYQTFHISYPSWPDTMPQDAELLGAIVDAVTGAMRKLSIDKTGLVLETTSGWHQIDPIQLPLMKDKD